jgi:predicted extracellular nuclease
LLGDFNDHPDSLTLRILRGEGHAPPGAVLTQSDLLFACAERVPAENRYSCIHGDRKTLIDHVLVSKSLFSQLQTFEIYNEDLRYHGAYADAVVPTEDSDHALCVASFA